MQEQLNSPVLDDERSGRAEDAFRRATFNWALATKKMVESAAALPSHTRVARTALVDIEYARDMLDDLYMPPVAKGEHVEIRAGDVKRTVSKLHGRVADAAREPHRQTPFNARMEPLKARVPEQVRREIANAHRDDFDPNTAVAIPPWDAATKPMASLAEAYADALLGDSKPARKRQAVDLSAPVHARNGKMLWANIDCPSCPSKASQRCQKPDGGFVEKPHTARENLAKQA